MTDASITVTDAMVEAYDEARSAARRRGGEDETRVGLTAFAPLIAAQALREVAGDIHQGLAGICHPECPGCRVERRADELEREDGRG